jgi:splicing factor 3B subunit 3
VSAATVGSFSGTKGQEILVVRGGTRMEMLKLNTASGHCECLRSLVSVVRKRNSSGGIARDDMELCEYNDRGN